MKNKAKVWSRILAVLTLLLITFLGYRFDDYRAQVPWLTNLQFRAYNAISKLEARRARPKFVVGVEIDDETFYQYLKLPSGGKTDRSRLAEMIDTLVKHDPALIALDIKLTREPADSQKPLLTQDEALLKSIASAARSKVPVVLTQGLAAGVNIFADSDLPGAGAPDDPYRTRAGFDNAPSDLREAPLVVTGYENGRMQAYRSF
jgi:CHASE2 domain-containing sensor protein